jgi:dTDP-4-amino-4,6-dideoxygalactose transaminase
LSGSPRKSLLVFGQPVIEEAEIDEVVDSLRRRWIGTGPKVARFERMLEDYCQVDHVRCLSSCTAALILALRVLGIGRGDEVLVPAMTFIASANAVQHSGATPVLVDSEPGTGNIDLHAAEAAITPRTRAIMPVHLAGRPVDLDRVAALARKHDLEIVEDAAHALGARWHDTQIGSSGNLTAFSFYATKNITTIEGGALATPDEHAAERVERLALHGLSLGAWARFSDVGFKHYEAQEPGFKFNMTDVQAAMGLHQLPRLDAWIDARAGIWQRYDERLAGLDVETPVPAADGTRHARHLYQVLIGREAPGRDVVAGRMHDQLIGIGVHYRGIHLHPFYRDRYGLRPEDFPVASDISERTLSLPLSPVLSEDEQDEVVAALRVAIARG